ncbi:hypothetical protein [Phyllobacterium sp. P30BS-XVII]|uniref:hypothetical protein n=1 Tax=Phyllobacterium sp. P30BS-XVII TaxID=2587046 RepID=UPI0015FA4596|nr:hypothetical protein [Phyllobacterium sp. P30BS-XVII]MBA8901488.1 hypothetical protein [Phyllobacterium sp. P30BS-XVII]
MTDYNFWQDFFDTYQSLSDLLKVLWLIVPPAFMLGIVALTLRFRIDSKRAGLDGELVYSVHRDKQNRVHIISHVKQIHHCYSFLIRNQANRLNMQKANHL